MGNSELEPHHSQTKSLNSDSQGSSIRTVETMVYGLCGYGYQIPARSGRGVPNVLGYWQGSAKYPSIFCHGVSNILVRWGFQFSWRGASFPRKNCMGVADFLGCQISCDTEPGLQPSLASVQGPTAASQKVSHSTDLPILAYIKVYLLLKEKPYHIVEKLIIFVI